ncbi:MAG: hypothetical protein U1E63_02065 [Burkholderiales bacterium]
MGYGFLKDGLKSGLTVANARGCYAPWQAQEVMRYEDFAAMSALLFSGRVHHRVRPTRHRFSYRVFFIRFRLDRMNALAGRLVRGPPQPVQRARCRLRVRDGSDLQHLDPCLVMA